jgi:hypothetical protein
MKRLLPGTLSCLVVVVALLALASRRATLFWLLMLALCLYLLLGRKSAEQCEPARLEVGGAGRHG